MIETSWFQKLQSNELAVFFPNPSPPLDFLSQSLSGHQSCARHLLLSRQKCPASEASVLRNDLPRSSKTRQPNWSPSGRFLAVVGRI